MGCSRCAELLRLAEEAIEVDAQVNAELAIAELSGSQIKANRLRNLAKSTEKNREWTSAAYRSHASSHPPNAKVKRAALG
jgi:hypothetical protein